MKMESAGGSWRGRGGGAGGGSWRGGGRGGRGGGGGGGGWSRSEGRTPSVNEGDPRAAAHVGVALEWAQAAPGGDAQGNNIAGGAGVLGAFEALRQLQAGALPASCAKKASQLIVDGCGKLVGGDGGSGLTVDDDIAEGFLSAANSLRECPSHPEAPFHSLTGTLDQVGQVEGEEEGERYRDRDGERLQFYHSILVCIVHFPFLDSRPIIACFNTPSRTRFLAQGCPSHPGTNPAAPLTHVAPPFLTFSLSPLFVSPPPPPSCSSARGHVSRPGRLLTCCCLPPHHFLLLLSTCQTPDSCNPDHGLPSPRLPRGPSTNRSNHLMHPPSRSGPNIILGIPRFLSPATPPPRGMCSGQCMCQGRATAARTHPPSHHLLRGKHPGEILAPASTWQTLALPCHWQQKQPRGRTVLHNMEYQVKACP